MSSRNRGCPFVIWMTCSMSALGHGAGPQHLQAALPVQSLHLHLLDQVSDDQASRIEGRDLAGGADHPDLGQLLDHVDKRVEEIEHQALALVHIVEYEQDRDVPHVRDKDLQDLTSVRGLVLIEVPFQVLLSQLGEELRQRSQQASHIDPFVYLKPEHVGLFSDILGELRQ